MAIPPRRSSNFVDNLFGLPTLLDVFNWEYKSVKTFVMNRTDDDRLNLTNYDVFNRYHNESETNVSKYHNDALSFTWYLASFGALLMFFVLISFSEVFCKRLLSVPQEEKLEVTSPPPYELFAPPTYDSLYDNKSDKKDEEEKKKKKMKKIEIFVVPMFASKTVGN